ncbi:MAG: hypothetical protein ABIH67_03225 [Candidatus Uhrbacteria bacterium]
MVRFCTYARQDNFEYLMAGCFYTAAKNPQPLLVFKTGLGNIFMSLIQSCTAGYG